MGRNVGHRALDKLEQGTGIQTEWQVEPQDGKKEIDGKVKLKWKDRQLGTCFVEVRKEIRNHHIPKLKILAEEYKPFLLIVNRLYPNVKKALKQAQINWIDGAGNIYFDTEEHFIWIDRYTTTPVKEKKNRAFTKTGLKAVFLFLHDEAWINKTYREIAAAADVALGNIKYVLDGLKQNNFLIQETQKKYKLINKRKLLERWLIGFEDELKPRLHVDNFEFLTGTDTQYWKNLNLKKEIYWGGEPGADILTNNLKPTILTLYTRKTKAALMDDYKLKPNPEGNVKVYQPYWTIKTEREQVAPPLVVYTDLMTTGQPRNIQVAETIYEKFLVHIA